MSEIENATENVTENEELTVEETVDTSEYVVVGAKNYKTVSITTGLSSIAFTLSDMPVDDAVSKFSDVKELDVSGADLQPYGAYRNLTFASATVNAAGLVTVRFSIASATDVRLSVLEQSQAEQNVVIADVLYGGVKNE